jgi:sugar lactone lactonase YvrE
MSKAKRIGWTISCSIVVLITANAVGFAQAPSDNPYRPVRGLADGGGEAIPGGEWAKLPGGREMGPPASVQVDVDGESIWALIRCDETNPVPVGRGGRFGVDCMNRDGTLKPHDTIYKFDPKGNVVKSFGAQMFIWPHGMHVDRDGNVWVTDGAGEDAVATAAKAGVKAGHIVRKFSPDGQVLMTLGEPGVPGGDDYHFRSPAGVVTAPNGDIFVADGHGSNNRIVKYSKDGKFIKAWGKTGYAPGEFRTAHCISMDKRGRLFVCDRSNTRIQIFDQDGKFLAQWHQFGMPSGIAFSTNDEDLIYVFDSESDNVDNPGFEQGIRIGDALHGWVRYFILDPGGNPNTTTGSGAEFGTVDKFGNVFAGEPRPRILRKYVKVR